MPKELSQALVEQFINQMHGVFNVRDIWAERGIVSASGKDNLRVILGRLCAKGLIQKVRKDGTYRIVDHTATEMDWQSADPNKIVPLKFPFELEKYAKIFPHSIILIAGDKNAGKTAFVNSFITLNMDNFPIDLYNSETGPEQMYERFAPYNIPVPAPFKVYERYENFADVIDPDRISVIDYLMVEEEFYMAGVEINNIFKKLKSGCAVVIMQKPPDSKTFVKGIEKVVERDFAYGGATTAFRSQLYIVLRTNNNINKLKLKYVKTPKEKGVNPNNIQWTYLFDSNGCFTDIKRYYETFHIDNNGNGQNQQQF